MSNLCTLIEYIQNLCLDNEEINNILKEIDQQKRENAELENKLEECDRENVRLQIEFHNLETITSFIDISAIDNLNQTSRQMFKDYIELRSLIGKIDFTKILKCCHMEMEAKCHMEWQPLQDCFIKTLQWHEKMEQRHIVKRYRQAEIVYRDADDANRNQEKSMENSLKQVIGLTEQAKEKINSLVIELIKGSKILNDFNAKMKKLNQYKIYIEELRQEKLKLLNQREQTHLKVFNPILNTNNNHNFSTSSRPNIESLDFSMPKLPSFADILKSFNETENLANVKSIENTSGICVKSILHTSNQSVTNKQTKNVSFKKQLDGYQEAMIVSEIESENDILVEEINERRGEKENSQELKNLKKSSNIEIVNLLTPVENTERPMDSPDYTSNSKTQIDEKPVIESCVVFKTPFPIREILQMDYKENVSDSMKASCSKNSTETYSSSSLQSNMKEISDTTKKSFYEEYLDGSSSAENSPHASCENNNKNYKTNDFGDFNEFLDNSKNFLFACKDSNEETEINETSTNFTKSKATSSEVQDFFDFSSKMLDFDSEDNMVNNYNSRNMDFM